MRAVDADQTEPEPVDDGEVVDVLPADLDVSAVDGDYTLPNNNRRRIPATLYLLIAAAAGVAWWRLAGESAIVNDGVGWAALALALFGVYGLAASSTLRIDESEALSAASRVAGFAVGHASAQMVWRGWMSKPVWRVLLYSAENPPTERALALVDGVDGSVLEWFGETNPEQWTAEAGAPPSGGSTPVQ
jgi:hypothetical protein